MEGKKQIYDVVIVGAGPAGMTASIYASRYKMSNVVIGPEIGGTIAKAHRVENYPGFISITGLELGQKMGEQVKNLGAEIRLESVIKIEKQNNFEITTHNEGKYYSKLLIIASGTERRKLNITGENKYLGKGVSYCTNCDAPFFRNKKVAVIGGGDAAVTGAIHLKEFAQEVYLIYRRTKEKMKAEPVWIEKLNTQGVISIFETNVEEIIGDDQKITQIKLDKPYNGNDTLDMDGVFIEIGSVPISNIVSNLGVQVDESGFIRVNNLMKTNIEGVYASGDITEQAKILQQLITAEAQGAIAAASAFRKLKGQDVTPKLWG